MRQKYGTIVASKRINSKYRRRKRKKKCSCFSHLILPDAHGQLGPVWALIQGREQAAGLPGAAGPTLSRGHIDQKRARVLRRLFLKSIYPDFRNSFVSSVGWHKSKLTYFDPPLIKRTPLMVKNMIFFFKMLILIAQKNGLGALNATQKPEVFAKYRYWENQGKPPKCPKNGHFLGNLKTCPLEQ